VSRFKRYEENSKDIKEREGLSAGLAGSSPGPTAPTRPVRLPAGVPGHATCRADWATLLRRLRPSRVAFHFWAAADCVPSRLGPGRPRSVRLAPSSWPTRTASSRCSLRSPRVAGLWPAPPGEIVASCHPPCKVSSCSTYMHSRLPCMARFSKATTSQLHHPRIRTPSTIDPEARHWILCDRTRRRGNVLYCQAIDRLL
jgi:hypothetical protein